MGGNTRIAGQDEHDSGSTLTRRTRRHVGRRRLAALGTGLVLLASTLGITAAATPAGATVPIHADAGGDQTVDSNIAVTLDGSGSFSNDGSLTYSWSQDSGYPVSLDDATSATPTFTAPQGPDDLSFTLTVDDGSESDTATTSVHVLDGIPVAFTGYSGNPVVGETITLDGSSSGDPGGQPLSYLWQQISGTPVELSDSTSSSPTFTAPPGPVDLEFELVVANTDYTSDPSDVFVSITPSPVVADAGPDQVVDANSNVALDGSASYSPDGLVLSYSWTQTGGIPVSLSDASAAQPTFTAPGQNSEMTFDLTVDDGYGDTATDSVTISMNDQAPTADAGLPQSGLHVGDTVTLDGSNSADADLESLTYAWSQTSGPMVSLSDSTSVSPTFTAPAAASEVDFELTVTDGFGATATAFTSVAIDSSTPQADAGPDQSGVLVNQTVTLDASATSDADGVAASLSWAQISGPTVSLSDPAAVNPTFTAPGGPTTVDFELTATDLGGSGTSTTDDVSISIDNSAPSAYAGSTMFGYQVGSTVTLDGSGSSDPDGSSLAYAWTQTSGPTVTLSDATSVSPTFAAPPGASDVYFDLVVTDDDGATSSASVAVVIDNSAPVADAGHAQNAAYPATVTLDGSGSFDPDGDSLTYTWTQTAGTTVALSDPGASQPTFAAPLDLGPLSFDLTVYDTQGGVSAPSSTTVTIVPSGLDLSATLTGVVHSQAASSTFKVAVTNHSTTPQVLTAANVAVVATVNGGAVPGGQLVVGAKTVTVKVGKTEVFLLTWNHGDQALNAGDLISVQGCATLAGDSNSSNDCSTVSSPTAPINLSVVGALPQLKVNIASSIINTVITNDGTERVTPLRASNVTVFGTINGVPFGSATPLTARPDDVLPGGRSGRSYVWLHPIFRRGDVVSVTTCVVVPGNTSASTCSTVSGIVPVGQRSSDF